MLWRASQGQPAGTTVLISNAEEEIAAEKIQMGCWPAVERVVIIKPEGIPYAKLIDAIVRTQEVEEACLSSLFNSQPLIDALAPLSTEAHQFADAACNLFLSLRRLDGSTVAHASGVLSFLQNRLKLLPPSGGTLLGKLTTFTSKLGRDTLDEWLQPALFIHPDTNATHKNWWHSQPSIAKAFSKSEQSFDAVFNGDAPKTIKGVRGWLTALAAEADKLYLPAGTARTEADVFRTASAFMTASADLHQHEGRYVLCLLCLHRACEWLLAALCADQNLLDFTYKDGLRLIATARPVTFDSMRQAAFTNGILPSSVYAQLNSLNQWRNLLTYTHHMSAPSATDVNALYTSLRNMLPKLAGNDWSNAVTVLTTPIPLSLADLLDPSGDLRNCFEVAAATNMARGRSKGP